MGNVTPAQLALAAWILAKETVGDPSVATLTDAAERSCQKLGGHLARLVAPAGYHALLARALHLSRSEFPLLEGVRAGESEDVCLEGLQDSVQGVDLAILRDALTTMLARVFELLATFIGEDLALRQARDIWPEAPVHRAEMRVEETQR